MISITCTSCKVSLVIDDAFAGGVCRCQHCGTIQTVPSALKPATPSPSTSAKALYQNKNRAHSDAQSGLEGLAEAVASSGLASGRLQSPGIATVARPTGVRTKPESSKKKRSLLIPAIIASGLLVLALLVVVAFLLLRPPGQPAPGTGTDNTSNTSNSTASDTDSAPRISGPSFCNVPLSGSSVVYVLDRGSATERLFDPIKAALYLSIQSLGPSRKFSVVLTDNGSDDFAFPASGTVEAGPAATEQLKTALGDVMATGASHFRSALEKAVASKPDLIVLVTAKWTIDDDDAAVLDQAAHRGIKIDTLAVGDTNATAPLAEAAKRSGGDFRKISEMDLRRFGS